MQYHLPDADKTTWTKINKETPLPPMHKPVLIKRSGRPVEIGKRVPGYWAWRGVYFETAAGYTVHDVIAWAEIPEYEEDMIK